MKTIEQLQEENAALMAQIEALRKALEYADNKLYILTHNRKDVSPRLIGDADKAFKVVRDTLAATPQQHLAEIRAEAVDGAADWLAKNYPHVANPSCGLITHYADSIRKGEVK